MEVALDKTTTPVQNRIENLRLKLLDFSKRNPLVSTPLGGRSISYMRVIDELFSDPRSLPSFPKVFYFSFVTQSIHWLPKP